VKLALASSLSCVTDVGTDVGFHAVKTPDLLNWNSILTGETHPGETGTLVNPHPKAMN